MNIDVFSLFDEKSMATRDLFDFKPLKRSTEAKRNAGCGDDDNESWLHNNESSYRYPPMFEFEQQTPAKLSSWCNSNLDYCSTYSHHHPVRTHQDCYNSGLFTPKPHKKFPLQPVSPDSAFDFQDHYIPKANEFLLDQTSVIFNSLVVKQQKQQQEYEYQQQLHHHFTPCMHSFMGQMHSHHFLPAYMPPYAPQPT